MATGRGGGFNAEDIHDKTYASIIREAVRGKKVGERATFTREAMEEWAQIKPEYAQLLSTLDVKMQEFQALGGDVLSYDSFTRRRLGEVVDEGSSPSLVNAAQAAIMAWDALMESKRRHKNNAKHQERRHKPRQAMAKRAPLTISSRRAALDELERRKKRGRPDNVDGGQSKRLRRDCGYDEQCFEYHGGEQTLEHHHHLGEHSFEYDSHLGEQGPLYGSAEQALSRHQHHGEQTFGQHHHLGEQSLSDVHDDDGVDCFADDSYLVADSQAGPSFVLSDAGSGTPASRSATAAARFARIEFVFNVAQGYEVLKDFVGGCADLGVCLCCPATSHGLLATGANPCAEGKFRGYEDKALSGWLSHQRLGIRAQLKAAHPAAMTRLLCGKPLRTSALVTCSPRSRWPPPRPTRALARPEQHA